MADDFGFFSSSESGAAEAAEEDPAAAFLAQQESEIAGIENDEGFGAPARAQVASAQPGPSSGGESAWWPGAGGWRLSPRVCDPSPLGLCVLRRMKAARLEQARGSVFPREAVGGTGRKPEIPVWAL